MDYEPDLIQNLRDVLITIADDHFILGHRMSQWCGHAPILEEDLSMPNMALDHLGIADGLFSYAAILCDDGRNSDQLAFLRLEHEYANLLMVEQPNGDFAFTMLREFYFAAFMHEFWCETVNSKDETVSAIAVKGIKETAYHVNHAGEWVVRLGDGTQESKQRLLNAAEELKSYVDEMFEVSAALQSCIDAKLLCDVGEIRGHWQQIVSDAFTRAKLIRPSSENPRSGGRSGNHEESFGHLLSELQFMQRTYPGLSW